MIGVVGCNLVWRDVNVKADVKIKRGAMKLPSLTK
jgi:hypothetical protein